MPVEERNTSFTGKYPDIAQRVPQHMIAADFAIPVIDGKQVDAFVAGNDEEALKTVSELVSTAGFNPIVAGDFEQ